MSNITIFFIWLVSTIFNMWSWRLLNRMRGHDPKPWYLPGKAYVIALMGAISGITTTGAAYLTWGPSAFLAGVIPIEVIFSLILFCPSWGEIFPATNETFTEKFAWGVKRLTTWIAGYPYNHVIDPMMTVFWKQCAWIARFGIYGTPLALLKCIAIQSAIPLLVWWLASLWVGMLYTKYQLRESFENKIPLAELKAGTLMGFIMNAMLVRG